MAVRIEWNLGVSASTVLNRHNECHRRYIWEWLMLRSLPRDHDILFIIRTARTAPLISGRYPNCARVQRAGKVAWPVRKRRDWRVRFWRDAAKEMIHGDGQKRVPQRAFSR